MSAPPPALPAEPGRNLCMLCLDGGGVRGLSSLMIVKQLMEKLDPTSPPKPCEYFDIKGGTSTAYTTLAKEVFTKNHYLPITFMGKLQPRFDSAALEKGIKAIITSQGLDENALMKENGATCKTFVCATSKQTRGTVVLSSYHSPRRSTDVLNAAKIWEVARATSAASTYFSPIDFCGEGFLDGGSGANNPIYQLWTEAGDQWKKPGGPRLEDRIQCLVSIGTGEPTIKAFGDDLKELGQSLLAIATDTEVKADQFQSDHDDLDDDDRLFRFNVTHGLENIGLEEASEEKKQEIIGATRKYLQSQTIYKSLARCALNLEQREWLRASTRLIALTEPHLVDFYLAKQGTRPDTSRRLQKLRWLLQGKEFKAFTEGRGLPFLCFLAPPGCGKSTLVQHVVGQAKSTTGAQRRLILLPCKRILSARTLLSEKSNNTAYKSSNLRFASSRTQPRTPSTGLKSLEEEEIAPLRMATGASDPDLEANAADLLNVGISPNVRNNGYSSQAYRKELGNMALSDHLADMVLSMLGRLLKQSTTDTELLQTAAKRFSLHADALERLIDSASSLEKHSQLWDLLKETLVAMKRTAQTSEVLIAVDDLDQMPFRSREEFVPGLRQFVSNMSNHGIRIQVLLTGRPELDLTSSLEGLPVIDDRAELEECLSALYYKELHFRRDRVAKSTYGTNTWIWGNRDFQQWNSSPSAILWIEGKPGCGKSTLAKAIQAHLEDLNARRPKNETPFNIAGFQSPLVTDHFYSARQHELGVSHELMLRSLLYQILKADSSLFLHVQGIFRSLATDSSGNVQWTWDNLENALFEMKGAQGERRRIFCILDALDESKSDERNIRQRTRVLKLLQKLCTDSAPAQSSASALVFKFLVLSRPARDIARGLKGCRKVAMHEENARDIRLLVDKGLQTLRELIRQDDLSDEGDDLIDDESVSDMATLSPSTTGDRSATSEQRVREKALAEQHEEQHIQEIRQYLIDNALGVVLWVLLVVLEELFAKVAKGLFSFGTLKERLFKLPKDLSDFYQRITQDLEQAHSIEDIGMSRKMLSWVACGQRPLSIHELWEAASIPWTGEVRDFGAITKCRFHNRSPSQLWMGMLNLCGPFIEVTHEGAPVLGRASANTREVLGTDTVQLLHQTVKEFLISPEAGPLMLTQDRPRQMFDACLTYISVALPIADLPSKSTTPDKLVDSYYENIARYLNDRPLLSYCLLVLRKQIIDASDASIVSLVTKDAQAWFLLGDTPGIIAEWRCDGAAAA